MEKTLSTKKRLIAFKTVQYLSAISILNTVLTSYKINENITCILITLTFLLQINNNMRRKYLNNNMTMRYYFSYCISVVIMAYFTYKLKCFGTEVYNIIFLIEIIVMNSKINILAFIFTFVVYLISNSSWIDLTTLYGIENVLSGYSCSILIVFLFRSMLNEKIKAEALNNELTKANLTLKEYSKKVQELAVIEERTKIAQELHDSIGHSLIALKMNLEYAENVIELKPEKAREVIKKAQNISKDCITNLRTVVSLIREDTNVENLSQSINELFENFKQMNSINFKLEIDEELEYINLDIKNCIYKTIREGVTNGIKHGKATLFIIKIIKEENLIIFTIKNNGVECRNIVRSNGISGIEKRITALGGKVNFSSEKDFGFIIEASIPEID